MFIYSLIGFMNGLIYAYPAQAILQYGSSEDHLNTPVDSKPYQRSFLGITPLLAGYIAEINLIWNFYLLLGTLFIFFIGFISYRFEFFLKVKESIKHFIQINKIYNLIKSTSHFVENEMMIDTPRNAGRSAINVIVLRGLMPYHQASGSYA